MDKKADSLLDTLAVYTWEIGFQDIPASVRRQAALNILDTVACIASGARLDESQRLLRAEMSAGGEPQATVMGTTLRLPIEAAARVNAYMGDVFELNDLIGGHASIAVVPAALALAEAIGATGVQLLEAVIAGIEVACRVHGGFYAHQKPFTETAMVQVTVSSAIGAAAAAAKLRGFDLDRTRASLTNAGTLASWGPAEAVFGEGNSLKPILFGGWPAAVGLRGALYAAEGIASSTRLLESPIGYYATVAKAFDAEGILDGAHWRLASPRRKLHACCGYMHSAIDTVAALRRSGGLKRASTIAVYLPAYVVPAVVKHGKEPTTPNEARFNIEYCLSLAAILTDVIQPEHSADLGRFLSDDRVMALMRQIDVRVDPEYGHYRYSRVETFDSDGQTLARVYNDAPRGTEWNPMTDEEVEEKFRRLSRPLLAPAQQADYIARVRRLEEASVMSWLMGAFSAAS